MLLILMVDNAGDGPTFADAFCGIGFCEAEESEEQQASKLPFLWLLTLEGSVFLETVDKDFRQWYFCTTVPPSVQN